MGAARVEITIGASWARESLRYWAASPEFVNSPPYSDILCFVHILIEHYWKYNNKNNRDIKLSYKAKPIFALSCNKARVLYQTLLAGLVCLTNHWFHNSMKLQMKYNSFMRHTVHTLHRLTAMSLFPIICSIPEWPHRVESSSSDLCLQSRG